MSLFAYLLIAVLLAAVALLFMRQHRMGLQLDRQSWPGGHPEDRQHQRTAAKAAPTLEEQIETFNHPLSNNLDWLPDPGEEQLRRGPEPAVLTSEPEPRSGIDEMARIYYEKQAARTRSEPVQNSVPEPAPRTIWDRLPHLAPLLFVVSMVLAWYGCATWYNNLARYIVPAADTLGDFRVLYLKKAVGALLPLLSSVVASLGLLIVLNNKFYYYVNGWTAKDFDFATDLKRLDDAGACRRVWVFCGLFGLFFLAFLYFFTLSPQDLTL